MKARAVIPVLGLIALPFLAACQPSSSSTTNGPVLTAPSSTAVVTPPPTPTVPAPSPTHTFTPKPVPAPPSHHCTIRYESGEPLPDPACTPGAVLTTSTANVCSKDWASKHREEFSKKAREVAFAKYGIVTTDPAGYGEYDHLIPLELGGSNSSRNLWPEPGKIPNAKDAVEDALHAAVCSGHASLAAAQKAISADWITAGTKVIEVGSGLKSATPATHAAPAPAPAPATSPAAMGYHWRQQKNGLRCVNSHGEFAKKSLCGG